MQGERLGPYLIDRELGSGGMGKVYAATVVGRALGLSVGDRVALKIVHPHLLETEGFFKRFLLEAQLGQAIRHENVVRTLDCDAMDGLRFLVMEYVEGQTLGALRRDLRRVPEELCRHVAREICKGLSAIHDAGVVHRDLKPDNVIIARGGVAREDGVAERSEGSVVSGISVVSDRSGRAGYVRAADDYIVKIMDLGVAKLADAQIRLSQTGAFVGSVEYAAPEQFKGGDVDGRTDLHALGVLLYELSSGVHPYRGGTFHEVLGRICDAEPRRLGDVNPQLSAFFEEVVHTLLVKDPRGRFPTAAKLLRVLKLGEDSVWWRERAREMHASTKRPIRRIRIPRETSVYGRDHELTVLTSLFDRAAAGDGRVVLIEGEAGIGKSRLVDEFVARVRVGGTDINFLFGSYPPGGAATVAGGFSSAFREHFGGVGCADYLAETPLLAPAFDALLQGGPSPADAVALTNDSLGTCFVHTTRNLAAERPTVVLIDDLHFAPEEALTLFTVLAHAVPGHRVLLVGTMRPGVSEDWIANISRLEQTSRLDVPRLGPKDLVALLGDSFKSKALAASLAAQVATKSDGNPFFAFEIIRGLREGQFIRQTNDGSWVSTQIIDEIEIPSSVLDLVNARVSDLDDEERYLLDVAACWGYEFDASIVGAALGLRRLPVLQAFAKIEKRDRLVRSSGRKFVFDHHQVQEALYQALPEMLREEYHGALAETLETQTGVAEKAPEDLDGALCVDLCEHYLRGGRGGNALRYLQSAHEHLSRGYLHAQAAALAERALADPDGLVGEERVRVLLRLASSLDPMGRRERQEEVASEAASLADAICDDALRGQSAMALGVVSWRTARADEAEVAYGRARDLARERGDQTAEAAAMGSLGNVFWSVGRLPEAREHHQQDLEICRAIGNRRGEAAATGHLGIVLYSLGHMREAQRHHEEHLVISQELGDRLGEASATGCLGNVFWSLGRLPEAQERYERYLELGRAIGNRVVEAAATGNLGTLLTSLGRLHEAQEHYERCLALSREIGDRAGQARVAGGLGNIEHALGRLREARDRQEHYLALSREVEDRVGEATAHHNLGNALREMGENDQCQECYVACVSVCDEIGHRHIGAVARRSLGSVRAAEGDIEGARELLGKARDLAREVGVGGVEVLALCELALLPGGGAQAALDALAEHAERLSDAERGEARLLLWKATGERFHLTEAKRLLDESLATVTDEDRERMCTNLRLHREIVAACRGVDGPAEDSDGPSHDNSDGSESITRVG